MGQEITSKFNLDLDDYLKNWEKVSDTLGQLDDAVTKIGKKNSFAEATAKQIQYNQQLGMQVQVWQRVEAAAVSYRKEQERIKQTTADIKKRQDELTAANAYGDLKKQIVQVEAAIEKSVNMPLEKTNSWLNKLRTKFAQGFKIPKLNLPDLPEDKTIADKLSLKDRVSGFFNKASGSARQSAANVGGAVLDEAAGAAGLNLSSGTLAAGAAVAATTATIIKGTKEWAAYSEKLSEVSALTGATGKSLDYLDDQAQKIEKSTGIAGTEVLDAFKNIAGIKPELLENNQALTETTKVVIELAQASKGSLDDTAKALLGSLSQFGEGADQAARFSNVLAAGAKLGNSEINDTSEALKNSGTAMKAAGLSSSRVTHCFRSWRVK